MINIADIKSMKAFKTNNNLQILDKLNNVSYNAMIFWLHLKIKCNKQTKSQESDNIYLKQSVGILLKENDVSDRKENEWNEPFQMDQNLNIYHIKNLKQVLFLQQKEKQSLNDTINEIYEQSQQNINAVLMEHYNIIQDTNISDFENKIKFLHKKRFCDELMDNALIPNICAVFTKWSKNKNIKKYLNNDTLFCIYMKLKYENPDISKILLSALDESKKRQEITANKSKQRINCGQFIKYIFDNNNINKTLNSILNDFYNKLFERDKDKLKLFQSILNTADSEWLIDSAKLCQIFKKKLNIKLVNNWSIFNNQSCSNSDARYLDGTFDLFFFIWLKLKYEEDSELLDIFNELLENNNNVMIQSKIFLQKLLSNDEINPLENIYANLKQHKVYLTFVGIYYKLTS